MKQSEIIKYYEENGGLRCKYWNIKQIKSYIKSEFGKKQRVYDSTCIELKRSAEMYQV
jgi:hypothetical protein